MKSADFHPETYRFAMEQALAAATKSDDLSTQVGAALVSQDGTDILATGANNMPEGILVSPERTQRPLKYDVREHAERDAIFRAARLGRQTLDSVMVGIWAGCSHCSRAAILAGVSAFVSFPFERGGTANHWDDDIELGREMLRESGVAVVDYDFPGIAIPPLRRNGELWMP
ncbi:MAG: deaminase [Acidobacteriota bacterium]